MVVRFAAFTIKLVKVEAEFAAIAEADIREAHDQVVARPKLSGVPPYLYGAAVVAKDQDQKDHVEEVRAQRRMLDGTREL